MASGETDNRPKWDAAGAAALLGRYVLVGITRVEADGQSLVSQEQFHGVIIAIDERAGISISCRGSLSGETRTLPPHLEAFKVAPPGEYRLRATEEIVYNPDFTSSWTIRRPPN